MKCQSINSITALLALLLTITLYSCGPMDAEETLLQAETELQVGDVSRAVYNCDILVDSSSIELSPIQLCRVALIYAKISERTEKEDYMATAAECLDRAMDKDNDSIDRYIETLNIEDRSYVQVIREVTHALNSPCDISRDIDSDEFDSDANDLASISYDIEP